MNKEELILYWQDQVGPDSPEDKARGAAIGALHWEMMQAYERMIERVSQAQQFMKGVYDAWPTLLKQAPLLGLYPAFLYELASSLLQDYDACCPHTSLEFWDNYENRIQYAQAGGLKSRISKMFKSDPRYSELLHSYATHPFKKMLEASVKEWREARPQFVESPEAWIVILENRRKAYKAYAEVFSVSFVRRMHHQTLQECSAKAHDPAWAAATQVAQQVAGEMQAIIDD